MTPNPLREPLPALQFLVTFTQADLDQLDPTDYLATLKALHQFLDRDRPQPATKQGVLTDETLCELQSRALAILEGIANKRRRLAIAGDLVLSFWMIKTHDGRLRKDVLGNLHARFLYRVVEVLEATPLDKLRKCPAPDCGRLFVRVTKKEYCSARCQSRIYMRQRREAERKQDRETLARLQQREQGRRHGKSSRAR